MIEGESMNFNTTQLIKKNKSKNRNVYAIPDMVFEIVFHIAIAFVVFSMLELIIQGYPIYFRVAVFLVVVTICVMLGVRRIIISRQQVRAYTRQKDFAFIGLYDLSKEKDIAGSSDVMPRSDEIECIKNVLETTIFPQSEVKQLLCITGESGCGKSTIISFFKNKYLNEYSFYDFTGDYNHLEEKIEKEFGSTPDKEIARITYSQKAVIILDQFERYFFLANEKKESVRKLVAKLACKNSAIIVSMREEYLADFLKEFDMNDLKAKKALVNNKGILRPLVSIIRDTSHILRFTERRRTEKTIEWKGGKIKNNITAHIQDPDDFVSDATIEQVGVTLFYCQNQNESGITKSEGEQASSFLRSKCERVFANLGKKIFDKYKSKPLIEQQIVYHMAEFDQKIRYASNEDLEQMLKSEDYVLLNHYFDIQLAACGNNFHASRILYLLSRARIHHVSMKSEDIKVGLYINQFNTRGNMEFAQVLEKLEELQLIKRSVEQSTVEYEIAHDFIATAFINYSNSNMHRSVKGALDIFLAEYLDNSDTEQHDRRIKNVVKEQNDVFYKRLNTISIMIILVIYVIQKFIYNPWTDVLLPFNPYTDKFLLFAPVITLISMLYLRMMYDRVIRYHHGKNERKNRVLYFILMIMAILSQACYPHILMIDGLCVAYLGWHFVFLLDNEHQESCRNELQSYGIKCALIGTVFAGAHLMMCYFNPSGFPDYIMFSENLMLFVLVMYSHATHMTKENLFGRMMDASSAKVKRKDEI